MKRAAEALQLKFSYSTSLVFLTSLIIQTILIGEHLDNSIVNSYAPTAVDAYDYVSRALVWREDGFVEAFKDAYRMPGYPAIILLFEYLLPNAPYLGVRFIQLIILAVSACIVKRVLEKYVATKFAVIAGLIYAMVPIWHFSPILLAESWSAWIIIILINVLSNIENSHLENRKMLVLSFFVALGTYFKPNNLILLPVVLFSLVFILKEKRLWSGIKISLLVSFFLLPWLLFVNASQGGFMGLTTNSGVNFYIGTGVLSERDGSLLSNSAIKWRVDSGNNPGNVISLESQEPPSVKNRRFTHEALYIWKTRPARQLGYSYDKVLFAFGLKSDTFANKIFGLFTSVSLVSALLILRISRVRMWGFMLLIVTMLLAFQAAIFQADRRFILPVFSPFAVMCLGLALWYLNSLRIGRKDKQ